MQIKDIFSDPCGDVFCYSVVRCGERGLEMLRWLVWPWHWWTIWGWWAVLCSEPTSELPAQLARPSMVLSARLWALCEALLQLGLNQDSITSVALTLKGTWRFQTIFVQSAVSTPLDLILSQSDKYINIFIKVHYRRTSPIFSVILSWWYHCVISTRPINKLTLSALKRLILNGNLAPCIVGCWQGNQKMRWRFFIRVKILILVQER